MLQTFIQNMLPKDGAAVYGKGMAGDMWKSLLAEKVAEVMADRGGIGIADRVLGDRYATTARRSQLPKRHRPARLSPPMTSRKPTAGSRLPPRSSTACSARSPELLSDEVTASPADRNPVHHQARIDQMSQYDSHSSRPEPRLATRPRAARACRQSARADRPHRGRGRRGNRVDPHRYPLRHQGVERQEEPLSLRTHARAERRRPRRTFPPNIATG